jgi:hypothetical protein
MLRNILIHSKAYSCVPNELPAIEEEHDMEEQYIADDIGMVDMSDGDVIKNIAATEHRDPQDKKVIINPFTYINYIEPLCLSQSYTLMNMKYKLIPKYKCRDRFSNCLKIVHHYQSICFDYYSSSK